MRFYYKLSFLFFRVRLRSAKIDLDILKKEKAEVACSSRSVKKAMALSFLINHKEETIADLELKVWIYEVLSA